MALRRKTDNPQATTTAPAPELAPCSDGPPAAIFDPEPAPQAAPPATTRPQAAAPAPVTLKQGAFSLIWEEKRDLFVSAYGELPRLKATNGNVLDGDGGILGDWIELQVLSFNELYVVGPCDDKAPTDLVRYSYDNETFQDGSPETVQEYVADMRNRYPNAASKKYYEVVGVLRASAKQSPHVGEMVQCQLSPTSVSGFEGYRKQTSFKIALGKVDSAVADLVRMETTVVSNNGNVRTKFNFKPTQL